MALTGGTSVEEILATTPAATAVFEILGIDSCCNRERSLSQASASAGIDTAEVIDLLQGHPVVTPLPVFPTAEGTSLSELTRMIVEHHHRRARKRLVGLIQTARTLCSAHGGRFAELWTVREHIEALARDLLPHMRTEERFLFPYIASFASGAPPDTRIIVPLFGTIQFPLQSLRHDHSDDLRTIATLIHLTRNFIPPEGSCARFRDFYAQLSDFARELQQHIHIENDVLFPRAVEMEKRAAGGAPS